MLKLQVLSSLYHQIQNNKFLDDQYQLKGLLKGGLFILMPAITSTIISKLCPIQ